MEKPEFDNNKFRAQLLETLRNDSETLLTKWRENCLAVSNQFAAQFKSFQLICEDYQQSKKCNPLVQIEKLNKLVESIAIPSETIRNHEQYRIAWKGALELLKNNPLTANEPIPPSVTKIAIEDSQIIKIKKKYMQIWINRKISQENKQNGKSETISYYRPIAVNLFYRVFVIFPVQQEILKAWNNYNRLFSGIIHSFQEPFIKLTTLSENSSHEQFFIADNLEYLDTFFLANTQKIDSWYNETLNSLHEYIKKQTESAQKKWDIAATPLCSEKTFNDKELKKLLTIYGKSFEKYRKAWKDYWIGEKSDWQKQLEISHIGWTSYDALQTLYLSIKNTMDKKIINRLQFMIDTFKNQSIEFQKKEYKNSHEIYLSILTIRKHIEKTLLKHYIPETIDAFLAIGLGQYNEGFSQILTTDLELIKDEYMIFRRQDSLQILPESLIDTVPMKKIVVSKAEELFLKLDEMQEKSNDTLIHISNELAAVGEIVTYMEDTVQELLEHSVNVSFEQLLRTVSQTVMDGFQQAILHTEQIQESVNTMISEMMNETYLNTKKFITSVDELRDNDKLIQLKLELIHKKAQKKISGMRNDLEEDVSKIRLRIIKKSSTFLVQIQNFINQRYRKLTKIARLQLRDDQSFREISEYLKRTKDKIAELPAVYRRLYRFEPLTNEKMYVERTNELKQLEQAYSNWKKGGTGLVALVGERGSGRTTFINHFKNKEFENSRLYDFEISEDMYTEKELLLYLKRNLKKENAQSLEELEQLINEEEHRAICIFENMQQIFLKTINGLELTKRFVLFTMRTDHNLFWLVSCSYFTWQFLNKVIGIASLFGNVIFLRGLTAEHLMNVILLRHRISGLQIQFNPGESIRKLKKYKAFKTEEIRQKWLRQKFFEHIEELSSGNISAAILYWQNNIKLMENKKMVATVEEKIDLGFLQNLPENDLFAIAVLIQHESISIKDFALVLNLTMDDAMLIITSLLNRGIVIEKNGKIELHFFLYRPLMRILYEKRLLH